MDVMTAIETRRTVKSFRPDPVAPEVLARVLGAARWAPNHRMTEPWRLRVLGPRTLEELCALAGDAAHKLRTAPVLVAASYVPSPLPLHATEDAHAGAAAVYAVLLAAQAEGLASFWRTPRVLFDAAGREVLGVPTGEQMLGLVYLGHPTDGVAEAPPRRPIEDYVTFLD